MSKITVMLHDVGWEFSRYEEDDELVPNFVVCKNLPEAKKVLKEHLQKALEAVDKIQLKNIK